MVNKCSVFGCFTNFDGHERGTVFGLHTVKDTERREIWLKFCNRKDLRADSKCIFVCEKHFDDKYIKRNLERLRLINELDPIPTISPDIYVEMPSCAPSTSHQTRKLPKERIFQQDEYERYKADFTIESFDEINESLLEFLGPDYECTRYDDHVIFYKFIKNELSVPEVTDCIRIDSEMHVKLFYKGSPIPLPEWFRKGSKCTLTSKDMLQNFPTYIRQESERLSDVLEELRGLKFKKKPVYSANLIRYALMLRYTSLAAYKLLLGEFNLPSISLLRKITSGKVDAIKSAKVLRDNGNISEDVILMFDEMYLQKCEEFVGGEAVGADKDGELYKGVMCFMMAGLKRNVPYVVKALPEKKIEGEWVKNELLDCLKILQENSFNVRGVVCDDHSTNVSAYKILLAEHGQTPDDLFITLNGKKIYLFFDTVHLIKNVRNNLLNRKRFLFPNFHFRGLYDDVVVTGGEISWRLLHEVYEKDEQLEANMKAAPKLTAKVLHPGNCKQNVPVALAIFDRSTSTAIKHYFPQKTDASDILNLFNVWWTVSNSKQRNNARHRLGDAAILNDQKPEFLRAFADWVDKWDNEKLPNCEKFGLSAQTSAALKRTLRCHAALIEDLLTHGYTFVLTARFQSDPLERRYGQYRQMSGGRFLVSLKDVLCSEKIIKVKSLVQEGFDIDDTVKLSENNAPDLQLLENTVEPVTTDVDRLCLSEQTREISNHIAGYVAYKLKDCCNGCCDKGLVIEHSAGGRYHQLLSRGGLKVPSLGLSNYVASGFAILDACSDSIRRSLLPARKAGEHILRKFLIGEGFCCPVHEAAVCARAIRIITNVFFNNQRKRLTEVVVNDRVVAFKKSKRTK